MTEFEEGVIKLLVKIDDGILILTVVCLLTIGMIVSIMLVGHR